MKVTVECLSCGEMSGGYRKTCPYCGSTDILVESETEFTEPEEPVDL